MSGSEDRILHDTPSSWLGEARRRLDAGHNLIPADDPSVRGVWFNPTEYPKLGWADTTDGAWHLIEIPKFISHNLLSAEDSLTLEVIRPAIEVTHEMP